MSLEHDFSWLTRRVGGKWEAELIAKVRIAPVEQWCFVPENTAHAGMEIEIETTDVETWTCEFSKDLPPARHWKLTRESLLRIAATTNDPEQIAQTEAMSVVEHRICEHMLEMD